jgi:hypothetical protein
MPNTRKTNDFFETSYFENVGGINNSDSPFRVKETQATGGANFEYTQEGGIQKRRGHDAINSIADTQLKTRGLELYNTTIGTKTLIRAADRKIQAADIDALTFTNLSQDLTAATTNVFPASTSTTTAFAAFNTDTVSLLNFVGNTDGVYSIYSPTKYTKNGAVPPAGSVTTAVSASGGAFTTSGTFVYAVSYLKTSTGAESNATLDVSATITNTTDKVTLTLSTLTAVDTATYNRVNIYRSPVGGSSGFTVGDLVATLTLPVASYVDTGTRLLAAQNLPRADSVIVDNSVLPAGTYNTVSLWKRRLVTAVGSTVKISDLNVPESWPTVNDIIIPSGGPITATAVISFNTDYGNDEYLAVFKERELWLIRGNDYTDFTLSFVDTVGCQAQSLITLANGFLTWVDYRGLYLWDGSGKPIYASKPIESMFNIDGDLDKSKLQYGYSGYFRTQNMVYWFLTSKTYGDQKICLKMDLRLTLPGVETTLSGRILPGVFVMDAQAQAIYACKAYIPTGSAEEKFILGDDSGFLYNGFSQYSDNGTAIDFQYYTPFLDLGSPNISKRAHKVIVWVDEIGDWDLTLDYWAGYRSSLLQKSTLEAPISKQPQNATALWDVAYWDQSNWDDFTPRLNGVVFNLHNDQGNSEGDCFRFRIRQDGVDQPVTVYGYTVIWTEKALSK